MSFNHLKHKFAVQVQCYGVYGVTVYGVTVCVIVKHGWCTSDVLLHLLTQHVSYWLTAFFSAPYPLAHLDLSLAIC